MWTWEHIRTEWLGEGRVAASPEDVVAAFEISEEMLGRDWLESEHRVRGASSVAAVVSMGQRLRVLRGAFGLGLVLDEVRAGSHSARSELTAAYLCAANLSARVEFGKSVPVGRRQRTPDFRIRSEDDPWIYVEVTAPNMSDLERRAHSVLDRLTTVLDEIPFGGAAEVMLRRDPSEAEVDDILQTLRVQLGQPGPSRADLVGLALLLVGHAQPTEILVADHGEPRVPRISLAVAHVRVGGQSDARKHIVVRHAFSDPRAEAFLTAEARQLPREAPGLVMIEVSGAPGAMRTREPLLRRRFQPRLHTRVSGVVLFSSNMWPLPTGEAWVPRAQVVKNPHATKPAPDWLVDRLASWVEPVSGDGIAE